MSEAVGIGGHRTGATFIGSTLLEMGGFRQTIPLDDHALVSGASENYTFVRCEHARQARLYKRDKDDPCIIPLYQAGIVNREVVIHSAVIEWLERWTASPQGLFAWV